MSVSQDVGAGPFQGNPKKSMRNIKCSQEKPSCYRCHKHSLNCVYSPLRRMGRPRKTAGGNPDVSQNRVINAQKDQGALRRAPHHVYDESRLAGTCGSNDQHLVQAPAAVTSELNAVPDRERSMLSAAFTSGENFTSIFTNTLTGDIYPRPSISEPHTDEFMTLDSHDDHFTSPNSWWGTSNHSSNPSSTSLGDKRFCPIDIPGRPELDLSREKPTNSLQAFATASSSATLNGRSSGRGCPSNGSRLRASSSHSEESDADLGCKSQCYVSILQRVTQLEQSLAAVKHPQVDLVLTAERDSSVLKERLLGCYHCSGGARGGNDNSNPQYIRFLSLAMLVERVVQLLEDMFHRAAMAAYGFDRSLRTAWYASQQGVSGSDGAGEPAMPSRHPSAARRRERLARSALDRNVSCPVPEANCELTIGGYEVQPEAKTRAMKCILRLRIGSLRRTIGDLGEHMVAAEVPGPLSSRADNVDAGDGASDFLGTITRSEVRTAALAMVESLHRRVELLQGRMELAE
ncbi:hypothetical protein GGR56DRAFT_386646 [Xylariaceae sp. FL0804]|nr:hypothetical protein GGR56DRAFT_386646 [Xylariaceae sp. FL0804]